MNINLNKLLFTLVTLAVAMQSSAQVKNAFPGQKTRILFLLDASGSMLTEMGTSTRWSAAVNSLAAMVDTLRMVKDVELGLRVFGHNKPITMRDCYDTKLEVPFAPNNHKALVTKLRTVKPLGFTSISQSLLATTKDFPVEKNTRNLIIIITDGIEECPADPCLISAELQKKGIILRPFVIGLGSESEEMRLKYSCAGKFFNAQSEQEFRKVIGVIVNQSLNNTSCQINLLDNQGQPKASDVPITIYDAQSGVIVENWVHTLNGKGIPDTFYLDPVRKYNIVVHTVPQIEKKDVEINLGTHNIIALDAPQGDVELKIGGLTHYSRLPVIVRKKGETKTLVIQDFNTKKRYLTGSYELEILSTPKMTMNIVVDQNKTTTVIIPSPGSLQLKIKNDMVAQIFQVVDGKMVWVLDVNSATLEQNFVMQPGDYKVVYRLKSETRTLYSKIKDFKIQTGVNTPVNL